MTEGAAAARGQDGGTSRKVARNSFLRAAGYAVGAGLFFLTVVIIARYLGVEGFGHYSYIMAVAGVFQLLADMGVRNVLIRDIARDPASLQARLGVARTLLHILSALSMAGVTALAFALDLEPEVRHSLLLAGLAVMTTFYALGYSAVLRALEHMDRDILGFVLHKVLLLGLVVAVAGTAFGLRAVLVANLVANFFLYLYYRTLVARGHGRTRLSRDGRAVWRLFAESFPLGVAEVLRRLTWQVDRLLLAALATAEAVGLFSTAYKFVEALWPLALNVTLPLFPVFARLARSAPERLAQGYARSLRYLYALGVPAAALLALFGERIIALFFGPEFRAAGAALVLVAPTVAILWPIAVYGYLFTALGRQRGWSLCVGLALAVKVGLDLWLIPGLAERGAALATLGSDLTLLLAGSWSLRRLGVRGQDLRLLLRPLLAALPLIGAGVLLRAAQLPVLVGGACAGLVAYALLLLALGTIERRELEWLRSALHLGRA